MSLILNIDTALDSASICLTKDEEMVQLAFNENQKDHAAWIHTAIAELLKKNNYTIKQLDAVAVSIGPGSYTGLRVGLVAAKGLCFALNIPLITVSTLEIMAFAVKNEVTDLICPLIDARRMEVFMAVYNTAVEEITPAHALIIDETSFASLLASHKVLFCGNGCIKLKQLINNTNASFCDITHNASHLSALSKIRFSKKEFSNLAYTEPLYIKEFYSQDRRS